MNHRALQRAFVIAQHDPTLLDAARLEPEEVLGELGLGEAERAVLLAVDPRALRTDPLRRRRLLRTLAEEYKASTTLILARNRSLSGLEAFFSSAIFRDAVVGDQSLPVALGEWLGGLAGVTGVLKDVVSLESTRARCRRAHTVRPGVGLAPGVAVLELDAASLPTINAVERWLFEIALMPQAALADDAARPPTVPESSTRETFLLQPAMGEVSLSGIDADLYRVLATFDKARPRKEAIAALGKAGVPAGRAAGLLEALLLEGLLSEGPPADAPRLA